MNRWYQYFSGYKVKNYKKYEKKKQQLRSISWSIMNKETAYAYDNNLNESRSLEFKIVQQT